MGRQGVQAVDTTAVSLEGQTGGAQPWRKKMVVRAQSATWVKAKWEVGRDSHSCTLATDGREGQGPLGARGRWSHGPAQW